MLWWRIKTYVDQHGSNATRAWYDSETPEVQAAFDIKLNLLAAQEDWFTPGDAVALTQEHAGHDLHEIRFEVECRTTDGIREPGAIVRCRPVGFIHSAPSLLPNGFRVPGEFVLLNACTKGHGRPYVQKIAFDLAVALKKEADSGKGSFDDADF